MKKQSMVIALCALTGCTSIDVPQSQLFPGITYNNRVFNKNFSNLQVSTIVTGTNGVSTNLTLHVAGWKSEAQYIADALTQAFVAGMDAVKKSPVP